MLGALLAAADERRMNALVAVNQPPLILVALPDEGAAALLLERGPLSGDELQVALDRLLARQAGEILHLVLCGGTAADHPILRTADSRAPDARRLGVHQLGDDGRLVHVAGRRLPLLVAAAERLSRGGELSESEIASRSERTRKAHEEAVVFSQAVQQRPPRATTILLGACVVYFLLSAHWSSGGVNRPDGTILVAMGANARLLTVEHLQLWRLLSHAFLHSGIVHLLVNLLGLWSFGRFLEAVLGWPRYLLLYGLSALAGGVASAILADPDPRRLSVGASGALFGLLGAGLGLTTARQKLLPPAVVNRLRPSLHSMLILNLIFAFVASNLDVRLDHYAHAGGAVLGFLVVVSGLLTRSLPPIIGGSAPAPIQDPPVIRVAALVMAAALAVSLALALTEGRPWAVRYADLAPAL